MPNIIQAAANNTTCMAHFPWIQNARKGGKCLLISLHFFLIAGGKLRFIPRHAKNVSPQSFWSSGICVGLEFTLGLLGSLPGYFFLLLHFSFRTEVFFSIFFFIYRFLANIFSISSKVFPLVSGSRKKMKTKPSAFTAAYSLQANVSYYFFCLLFLVFCCVYCKVYMA